MPAWLTELTPDGGVGQTYPVDPDASTTIGRAPDNSIVIRQAGASRHHAKIWQADGQWMVEDLGTKNGTAKNGRRLTQAEPLAEGDEVGLPGLLLRFHATDATMTVTLGAEAEQSATRSFLFADLRDFTTFTEQRGDAAAHEVVDRYRSLVRSEIARTGGREVNTEGDGFFVVFGSAHRAVDCALGILRAAALESERHPDRPIRVGVGIHTGEPIADHKDYVGLAVDVAARLAQNARAGELLISDVVRELLRGTGPSSLTLREGVVLKGIQDPPRVYSVTAD